MTEIHDYLRVLWARVGKLTCYNCGRPVSQQSSQQIVAEVASLPAGTTVVFDYALPPSSLGWLTRIIYRRVLAREDRTTHIHLSDARVLASGVSPLPPGGMHWRGRLSEVSGWSFGHLGEPSPAPVEDSDRTM